MYVHGRLLPRALRRISVIAALAVTITALPVAAYAQVSGPAPTGGSDPGGNNGTVKIVEDGDFDSIPNNDPHVGCTFTVEWYGYDKGADIISTVTFEMQSPTQSVGLAVDGPSTVFVGGDAASGAGTPTGRDGRQAYTLSFDGPPHPIQGYHLKLAVQTPGSKGSDKKYKVFWVTGCAPVQPPTPGISLEKSVTDSGDADQVGSLGETLTYAFDVTNTGNVPLTDVRISDPRLGLSNVACVATLAVGATATCPTRTYVVTAADIAAGSVHNTATVTGTPPTGPPVTDDDHATIPTPPAPAIRLDKAVTDSGDAGSVGDLGETLTYTFAVTNTGNVPLTDVTISDARLGLSDVACVATLAVGATATCPSRTYVVTAADVTHGSVDNVAIAKGTPPTGSDVSDDDDASIPTRTDAPAINVEKSVADSDDADSVGSLGETLTYRFTVTNTGNVPLTDVTISDPKLSMTDEPCVANLAVGASATCPTRSYPVSAGDVAHGSVHNVATVRGLPPTGPPVDDEDDSTIPTPATPRIHLEKSVADSDDAGAIASVGETLTYTFEVTNTGNVPLTGVTLDDPKLGLSDAACVANLAVGATALCPAQTYTVTSADVRAGAVHNTATATGTPPSGPDVSDDDDAVICTSVPVPSIFLDKQVADSDDADTLGSLGEVLTYTFDVTNTGNVDLTGVTINDPMFGLTGAPCVAGLAVGATTSCPLLPAQSHTVTAADVAHGSVDNTATTSGTPPTGPDVSDDDDATIDTEGGDPDDSSISVEKSSDVDVAAPGDTVTYTLNVRNSGAGDAHDVVVTDTLPSGTTYQSSSAPCTHASGTVTCSLGTVEGGDDATVTITVKVHPSPGGGGGTTSHQHHVDYTKVESHLSVFESDTTGTTMCPSGYHATDGSVRLDHVDQGAGTFEDVEVLASAVTADGRGWTGTVRNNTVGQVQAKVMVVCMTEETSSGDSHRHPVVVNGPVATTQALASGRHDVDVACGPDTWAIDPSYVLTAGSAVVGTRRTPSGGWRFIVEVDDTVTGTFSVRCLSTSLGTVQGHTHDLNVDELGDSVTVPAGQTVERKLTCRDGYKGIVAWADIDPGLVPLGHDPQPITRVFKFYNPSGGPLTARYGLLCVSIRTRGADNPGDTQITNTASVTTSSPDATNADNTDSATVTVTPTGVSVAPRAVVVSGSGTTAVKVQLSSSSRRRVTMKLLAAGRIGGTHLEAGSLLAQNSARLRSGDGSIRLIAKGAAVQALRSGKVGRARLVITSGGHRSVTVIKLR